MALLPKLVPADPVLASEAFDVLGRCHQWEVRGVVGQIVKKRLLLGYSLIDIPERPGRPQVRTVPVIAHFTGICGNLLPVVKKLKACVVDARAGLAGKIEFAEWRAKGPCEAALPGRSAVLQ